MTETRKLSCRFYRLLSVDAAGATPMGQVDFADLLNQYQRRTFDKRKVNFDTGKHVFEKRPTGERHLAIHRLRDEHEFISRVARDGTVTEMMALDEDGNNLADTSCIAFSREGNTFGIVGAGAAAPRANRVADWLNQERLLGDIAVAAHPITSPADFGWEQRVDGASRLEARFPVSVLDEIAPTLGATGAGFAAALPGAMVDLVISYGRRRPTAVGGATLFALARRMGDLLRGVDGSAKASLYTLVQGQAKTKKDVLLRETVELVEYHLAHVIELPLEAGDQVKIGLTLERIDAALLSKRDAIGRAIQGG